MKNIEEVKKKWSIRKRVKRMRKALKNDKLILLIGDSASVGSKFDTIEMIIKTNKHHVINNDKHIDVLDDNNVIFLAATISHEFKMSIVDSLIYAEVLKNTDNWREYIHVVWKGFEMGMELKVVKQIMKFNNKLGALRTNVGKQEYTFLTDVMTIGRKGGN